METNTYKLKIIIYSDKYKNRCMIRMLGNSLIRLTLLWGIRVNFMVDFEGCIKVCWKETFWTKRTTSKLL